MPKDLYYVVITRDVALGSEDQSRQIGALIFGPEGEIRSTGYNGMPRKVANAPERNERPNKYFYFEHAERNAVYQAARSGISVNGCTMVISSDGLYCCSDCSRAIIQSGIKNILFDCPEIESPPQWKESIDAAKEMLLEAGIGVRHFNG